MREARIRKIFRTLQNIGRKIWGRTVKIANTRPGKIFLALISFASFAYLFKWKLALLLMPILYIHECGHFWAMEVCGMKPKGIYFLPFLGAATISGEKLSSCKNEAIVAIMGPLWGLGLTLYLVVLHFFFRHPIFLAVAFWSAIVNLMNLLPLNPLDGGKVVKAIINSINRAAVIVFLILGLLATAVLTGLYIAYIALDIFAFFFALILAVAFLELRMLIKNRQTLPKMKWRAITVSAVAYGLTSLVLWELAVYAITSPGTLEFMWKFLV